MKKPSVWGRYVVAACLCALFVVLGVQESEAAKEKGTRVVLKVEGMTCGGCVANVTRNLKGLKGVLKVDVTLKPGKAVVVYNAKQIAPKAMLAKIKAIGYKGSLWPTKKPEKRAPAKKGQS